MSLTTMQALSPHGSRLSALGTTNRPPHLPQAARTRYGNDRGDVGRVCENARVSEVNANDQTISPLHSITEDDKAKLERLLASVETFGDLVCDHSTPSVGSEFAREHGR